MAVWCLGAFQVCDKSRLGGKGRLRREANHGDSICLLVVLSSQYSIVQACLCRRNSMKGDYCRMVLPPCCSQPCMQSRVARAANCLVNYNPINFSRQGGKVPVNPGTD